MREPLLFRNYYRHCQERWIDSWSCACNDECPICGAEIEPYRGVTTALYRKTHEVIQRAAKAQGAGNDHRVKRCAVRLNQLLGVQVADDVDFKTVGPVQLCG